MGTGRLYCTFSMARVEFSCPAQGRPEEPRVPQDLKKNDMVYLTALLETMFFEPRRT